ncbi:MAG: hypothetical protein AAGD25_16680 [Cyanobacteria bacterium P01_F01_bin.150]
MSDSSIRIQKAREYVNHHLKIAKEQTENDFPDFSSSTEIHQRLTELIDIKQKGFRGVVVTALAGIYLNSKYDPINNFYGCSPRSIFEKGIWYALDEHGVPCGKSAPLNVAKNADTLNKEWAKGRRPQKAADAVVYFLTELTYASESYRNKLIDYFFFRLASYAKRINEYEIVNIESSPQNRHEISSVIVDFTLQYPESGQLPQFLVAQTLAEVFRYSTIEVCGGGESVFGTNTTSKKPADIWLEKDGAILNLYEITVKSIDRKRLEDSLDALKSTNHLDKNVYFICRLPTDVSDLKVENGSYLYKGKNFNFVDYKSFLLSLYLLLSDAQFESLVEILHGLIQDKNTSERTKKGWNQIFQA